MMKKLLFLLAVIFGSFAFNACTDEVEEITPQFEKPENVNTDGDDDDAPPPPQKDPGTGNP
ncbi:hypothetical protein QQ008_18985 [Fulvivirgaceae bacterium BMA10]|uniref:Uncharacterized protein n=1 Tax=Splendidivirga corallicola TaxID=3051826 RepID=A0ABT8KRW2_9BACT|nr:hypothetical protein [Fulvivirgaceae bacterium BMA10]